MRRDFLAEKKDGRLQFAGVVTIDGVHLKLQGRNYYDFTLHFLKVKENVPFYNVSFFLRNFTYSRVPKLVSFCERELSNLPYLPLMHPYTR